jgi:hypothetical protein
MEPRSLTYIDVMLENKIKKIRKEAKKEIRKNKFDIAEKLLNLNIPIEQIVIVTGLKKKEILLVQQAQKNS